MCIGLEGAEAADWEESAVAGWPESEAARFCAGFRAEAGCAGPAVTWMSGARPSAKLG